EEAASAARTTRPFELRAPMGGVLTFLPLNRRNYPGGRLQPTAWGERRDKIRPAQHPGRPPPPVVPARPERGFPVSRLLDSRWLSGGATVSMMLSCSWLLMPEPASSSAFAAS